MAACPSFFASLWETHKEAVKIIQAGEDSCWTEGSNGDSEHWWDSPGLCTHSSISLDSFSPKLCTCITTTCPPLISLVSPPPKGQESSRGPHSFLGYHHLCTYHTIFFSNHLPLQLRVSQGRDLVCHVCCCVSRT